MHPRRNNETSEAAGLTIAHQLDTILTKFDNFIELMPQEIKK